MEALAPSPTHSVVTRDPTDRSDATLFNLKPAALQDETYRWSIGIFARPAQHAFAKDFEQGLHAGWPSLDHLLTIPRFTSNSTGDTSYHAALVDTPCDLLFVFDDPEAPEEIDEVLRAAVRARHTPIRVTDPASAKALGSASALSWAIISSCAQEQAAGFALAVFGAILPKGPICVDWADLLQILDAPGRSLEIVHCAGDNWAKFSQTFRAVFGRAGRGAGSRESVNAAHTTFIHNGSLRMAQLRELVTRQRQELEEHCWYLYGAPVFVGDRFCAFGLRISEQLPDAPSGSPPEPHQRR
jgi:hypothetical protein